MLVGCGRVTSHCWLCLVFKRRFANILPPVSVTGEVFKESASRARSSTRSTVE
jgi:hypothetical protein